MIPFVETRYCLSGAHCGTCRNRAGGRLWRQGIAAAFVVVAPPPSAENPADWPCPHGKPWGYDALDAALDRRGASPEVRAKARSLAKRPCGCGKRSAP